MIRDLAVTDDGEVTFTFLLAPEDPATLVRQARRRCSAVEGVAEEIKITVTNPGRSAPGHPRPATGGRCRPAGTARPQPMEQPNLGKIIAISSGKGGVGKSTVAANLAVALAQAGFRVGVMDADIYGPNIPRMFGVFERPPVVGGKIQPLEAHGVKLMSLGFLVERDAPAIWRGPIIMKIVSSSCATWTGASSTTSSWTSRRAPATRSSRWFRRPTWPVRVIVTTPQEVAVGDALRGAKMFERVGVPVLGVVENMSAFVDPETGRRFELFSSGGGQRLADEIGVPLLGIGSPPAPAAPCRRRGPAGAGRPARQPCGAEPPGDRRELQQKTAGPDVRAADSARVDADIRAPHHSPYRLRHRGLLRRGDEGCAPQPYPGRTLVDITHAVPPGDLRRGSLLCSAGPGTGFLPVPSTSRWWTPASAPRAPRWPSVRRPLVRGPGQRALHPGSAGREVEIVSLPCRRRRRRPSMAVTSSLPPRRRSPGGHH